MRRLGRTLQIFGLVVLPVAMLLELTRVLGDSFGLRDMLMMLVFGATAFMLGRYLEGYSPS
ncbi:MAG: hypothetical protein R3E01_27600 [Pirellulaceae bacterium]|nr:hypothetical protein [Planctomycetales bacterium]